MRMYHSIFKKKIKGEGRKKIEELELLVYSWRSIALFVAAAVAALI